ncbi:hypothetical protein HJC23_013981 [Cyclotella cryptica]|uniref:Uncharacterized protein n=1 Tax=Cyclotella cryptica TaxID=29204 RepID=A0ABD3Q2L3_9STRA|eukprot:CCRYP_009240-RB/>CCRYP_009240-RB protein AED:0.05 eAED:0.05 QI:269/1/1/1/0.33/0.25/4/1234/393
MRDHCGQVHALPLRIVIGSLSTGGAVSPRDSSTTSSANYIIGTSYYATPRLGALKLNKLNKDGRVPMEDRKEPFEHLRPKALVLSTIRVTAVNISTTISAYFSDQLQSEQRIESLVDSGKLTPHEADELNEQWEEREWKLRKDALPKKVGLALVRFHACTALMRFYELVLGRYILKVDSVGRASLAGSSPNTESAGSCGLSHVQAVSVMDKLTRDPFQASLRTSQLLHNQEHALGKVLSLDGIETSTRKELVSRMFSTCLWANIVPFLAELTVQQVALFYGYGMYYLEKRRRQKERGEMLQIDEHDPKVDAGVGSKENSSGHDTGKNCDENVRIAESAYALSLMLRSSHLTIARSMGWIAASAGGAVGSLLRPGWGTVFGIQFGDAIIVSLTG